MTGQGDKAEEIENSDSFLKLDEFDKSVAEFITKLKAIQKRTTQSVRSNEKTEKDESKSLLKQ